MKLKCRRVKKPKREMGWNDFIQKLFKSHVRYWYTDYTNAICISCSKARHRMIRVGTLFFCVDCFTRDFDYTLKEKGQKETEMYRKYYTKYVKQLEDKGLMPKKGGKKC